ncbi:MAG: UbiA family prenyltransferase [Candidatus Hodarchaeales archaeon]
MTDSKPPLREYTLKSKIVGIVRLARPQFLAAYTIVGITGIAFGVSRDREITDASTLLFGFLPILIAATSVHFRDEAGDWLASYDKEHGGAGVIREGLFQEKTVRYSGFFLMVIAIALGIFQAFNTPILFLVGIPMLLVILFPNYLTEEVPLGHELVTASSYGGTILWVYLYQGWPMNLQIALATLFIYLIVLALIPYQDIGDISADLKSGKKTITARLGLDEVGQLCIALALLSLLTLCLALVIE